MFNNQPTGTVISRRPVWEVDRTGSRRRAQPSIAQFLTCSGSHRVKTSSLTMEVEAVTRAMQWLASQRNAQIAHAIILTDTMNLLQKVESRMGCPDWHTVMHSLRLQKPSVDLLGHAGVNGNEQTDRLASPAFDWTQNIKIQLINS